MSDTSAVASAWLTSRAVAQHILTDGQTSAPAVDPVAGRTNVTVTRCISRCCDQCWVVSTLETLARLETVMFTVLVLRVTLLVSVLVLTCSL